MDLDELKKKLLPKFKANTMQFSDLPDCLDLLTGLANTEDDYQDEYMDFTKTYQFAVTDKPEADWMYLKIEKGKFSWGKAKCPGKIDLTFSMTAQLAADMISGKVDSNSAFITGSLKIDGQIKDGKRFQEMQAIMRDLLGL